MCWVIYETCGSKKKNGVLAGDMYQKKDDDLHFSSSGFYALFLTGHPWRGSFGFPSHASHTLLVQQI